MITAGIIGGAGFTGSYVAKKFLDEGFRVKVSAMDHSEMKTCHHLEKLPNARNLGIYPLDLRDISALTDFVDGCNIVIHCIMPFHSGLRGHDKNVSESVISGTWGFLTVVQQTKSVEHVVMVSSASALNTNFPLPAENRSPGHIYTENDKPCFNGESQMNAQASYYTDQAVERFIRVNPECNAEIVRLYPVLVMGPALLDCEESDTVDLQYLFKYNIAPNLFIQRLFDHDAELAIVDVRDVADGTYKAATTRGLHGEKYYLSNESWRVSDISRMLNQEQVLEYPGFFYSSKKAKLDLVMNFRPASESLTDYSLWENVP